MNKKQTKRKGWGDGSVGKVGCVRGSETKSVAHTEEPGMAKCAYNPTLASGKLDQGTSWAMLVNTLSDEPQGSVRPCLKKKSWRATEKHTSSEL